MHTEDDTFAALKRIPYIDMAEKIRNAMLLWAAGDNTIDLDELCQSHGWTYEEYRQQVRLRFNEGLIIKTINPYKAPRDKVLTKFKL